jgi:predicted nucleic acid-binding protein
MKNRRVILDANLWISFIISKRQKELDVLLESGAVTSLSAITHSQNIMQQKMSMFADEK